MGLFNFRKKSKPVDDVEEKLNPGQKHSGGQTQTSREPVFIYERAYENIEIVNRGVNLIVDDTSQIPVSIGDQTKGTPVIKGMRKNKLYTLLNHEPNPFQDVNTFRRNILIDLILDGNIFLYFDGTHLYHLPAKHVNIHTSKTTYIEKYTYHNTTYYPDEIIHVKDNSFYSIYRGVPRLRSAIDSMKLLGSMRRFQSNFFKNGAVASLVFKSPDTLSQKIKERMIADWMSKYNPETGGQRPMILDGGLTVDKISQSNFKELDFEGSVANQERIILKALGVPPVLLDSGNNANIRPNMRLFYLETVIPITKKINAAFSRFFGYEIWEDLTDVQGVQPELADQASYFSTLTNGGIVTANESRFALGYPKLEGHDDLRIPANIAGSAANPAEGGRPAESED